MAQELTDEAVALRRRARVEVLRTRRAGRLTRESARYLWGEADKIRCSLDTKRWVALLEERDLMLQTFAQNPAWTRPANRETVSLFRRIRAQAATATKRQASARPARGSARGRAPKGSRRLARAPAGRDDGNPPRSRPCARPECDGVAEGRAKFCSDIACRRARGRAYFAKWYAGTKSDAAPTISQERWVIEEEAVRLVREREICAEDAVVLAAFPSSSLLARLRAQVGVAA